MARLNLSDEQIQEHLDGLREGRESTIQGEKQLSAESQAALDEYRSLYRELSEEVEVNLSQDFSRLVMERVEAEVAGEAQRAPMHAILSVVSAVLAVGVVLMAFSSEILGVMLPVLSRTASNVQFVRDYLAQTSIDLNLLGLSVLVLILLTGIDYLVRHSRSSLFQSCLHF